jgi:hypothetical protein
MSGPPIIPLNTFNYGVLDNNSAWKGEHDPATPGTSAGTSSFTGPVSGRNFSFNYTANGGQRYSVGFATDLSYPLNFCFDLQVVFGDPSQILNMELDLNQVLADGRTAIFACQCASGSGTWEANAWKPSRIFGNPQQWGIGIWHRIRLFWHRSADGNTVCFDGIDFDGSWTAANMESITQTLALGWIPLGLLLINFQIEGASRVGGSVSANARNMQVWSW